MFREFGVVLVSMLVVTGCAREDRPSVADIQGFWVLESLEVAGVEIRIEVGVNAAQTPWIEIGTLLSGNLGCNGFRELNESPFVFFDGVLVPGEMMQTAMLCGGSGGSGDPMTIERMFVGAMSRSRAGFQVEVTSSGMAWVEGDTRLVFTRSTGPPQGPPMPPETGIDRLDCLPGIMVREEIPDTGVDGEQILRVAVSGVVSIETDPPGWFWWGYDAAGAVIAAVAKGDIVPVIYELFTCVEG